MHNDDVGNHPQKSRSVFPFDKTRQGRKNENIGQCFSFKCAKYPFVAKEALLAQQKNLKADQELDIGKAQIFKESG